MQMKFFMKFSKFHFCWGLNANNVNVPHLSYLKYACKLFQLTHALRPQPTVFSLFFFRQLTIFQMNTTIYFLFIHIFIFRNIKAPSLGNFLMNLLSLPINGPFPEHQSNKFGLVCYLLVIQKMA